MKPPPITVTASLAALLVTGGKKRDTTLAEGLGNLSGSAIAKMDEKELCETFAKTTAISHRAFSILGKLRYELEEKSGKDGIYAKLAAYGVESTDISNAGPATNVWRHMVKTGHMTEEVFDKTGFHDCRAIARVLGLSEKSPTKKKLSPDDVAEILKRFPKGARRNLECVAEHGVLLAEHEANLKAEAEKKNVTPPPVKPAASAPDSSDAEDETDDETPKTLTGNGSTDGETVTHEVTTPTKPAAEPDRTPPKAKATGYARAKELLAELGDAILDGVTPAQAQELFTEVSSLAEVLAEFADLGKAEAPPTPPARGGKVNGKDVALHA